MKNSRRPLIAALAIAALALTTALPFDTAHAEAPMAKTQAPGWYRMKVGAFEVTALSDGTVALPMDKLLMGQKAAVINGLLARAYLKAPVETSVNGYLVNTGGKLVLIDAGAAGLFGPTLGKLVANLKAAGYTPEQVDEIYITHMHPDHVGGLVANGQRVFTNAVVRADLREGGFWLSQENLDKAQGDTKGFFQGAMASLNPYVAAGKLKPFDGATELVPGIRAVPAAGHTPGHTIFVAESEGSRIAFWGDLMHVAAVQFPLPSTTIAFDTDGKAAAPARFKNFADAAKQGYFVAVAHVSFPGIGQLRADGRGYQWVPANYQSAP
jgi:glyoxylase-like metal-dependent hydrolase (beta-lactamase superfamily II)